VQTMEELEATAARARKGSLAMLKEFRSIDVYWDKATRGEFMKKSGRVSSR